MFGPFGLDSSTPKKGKTPSKIAIHLRTLFDLFDIGGISLLDLYYILLCGVILSLEATTYLHPGNFDELDTPK